MDIAHLSEQNHLDIFGKKCYSSNPSVVYYIWPCCACKTNTYWSQQCAVNWHVYELTDRSCVRLSVRAAGYQRWAGEVRQLVELPLCQSWRNRRLLT